MSGNDLKQAVIIADMDTGAVVGEGVLQARPHVTNFQAMIHWKGIVTIQYGDSMQEAVQAVLDEFSGKSPLRHYDVKLGHRLG
jgi:hypothetical protein